MINYILGVDNGTTGKYCLLDLKGNLLQFVNVPIYNHNGWSKPKKVKKINKDGSVTEHIKQTTFNFIDVFKLKELWETQIPNLKEVVCYLERPAVNYNARWSLQTSLSAFASWMAVITVLRILGIEYHTIDSKEWQSVLIPEALGKNNKEYVKKQREKGERNKLLKQHANEYAQRLYPNIKIKDGDSICIAECFRQKYLKSIGENDEKKA